MLPTMSAALRIGLIGAGLIGQKHAKYLKASTDCDLTAIADPSAHSKKVAADHGVRSYTEFDHMLAQEDLNGVIIATPNDVHETAGIRAAEHGLPMVVEKPIAADLDAAARLTDAANDAGVALLVGHHRRYNPGARRAREVIEQGALGRLIAINTIWCVRKPYARLASQAGRRPDPDQSDPRNRPATLRLR